MIVIVIESTSGLSYFMELSVLWSESCFSLSSFTLLYFFVSVRPSLSLHTHKHRLEPVSGLHLSSHLVLPALDVLWLLLWGVLTVAAEFFPHVNSSSRACKKWPLLLLTLKDPCQKLSQLCECLCVWQLCIFEWLIRKESSRIKKEDRMYRIWARKV